MAETVRVAETPAAGTVRGPRAGHLRSLAPFPLIVVAGLILPWVTSGAGLFLWELIVIQVVFALGTNLLVGHANIHTFGQAAFYGVGGYAAAVLALEGWNAWLALIAAIVLGSLLGGFVGGLTMRMTGMGTLMVTVAVAQCFSMLSGRLSVFGGDNGLSAIANGFPSTVGVSYWYLLLGICLVAIALMWVIVHSPFGAVLHALRDDPVRVVHMGVDVRRFRVIAFTLSGAFCGLAGSLAAYTQSAVSPEFFFWVISGNALIMCVLGGLNSFWGPALGAVVYVLLSHELQSYFPDMSILAMGIALLVVVLILPRGLVEAPRRLALILPRQTGRKR